MRPSALSIGRTGELIAAASLQTLGFHAISVSNKKYDLLVDFDNRFLRVQVKACLAPRNRGAYEFKTAHGKPKQVYTQSDVDLFALVAIDLRRCVYVATSQIAVVTVRQNRESYLEHEFEGRSLQAALEAVG